MTDPSSSSQVRTYTESSGDVVERAKAWIESVRGCSEWRDRRLLTANELMPELIAEVQRLRAAAASGVNAKLLNALRKAKKLIEWDNFVNEDGTLQHSCEFLTNPPKGACDICDAWADIVIALDNVSALSDAAAMPVVGTLPDGWISVKDRLPEFPKGRDYVPCLVTTEQGQVVAMDWARSRYAKTEAGRAPRWTWNNMRSSPWTITHWLTAAPANCPQSPADVKEQGNAVD